MCQADVLDPCLNSNKPVAANRRSLFAMKLPRVGNVFPTPASNRGRDLSSSYHRRQQQQSPQRQQDEATVMTTPRASGRGYARPSTAGEIGSASSIANATGGATMRRSQSANATARYRPRATIAADTREHSMHKSRSHSQEPIPSSTHQQSGWYDHHDYQDSRTQELPIPPADQYNASAYVSRHGPSITVENKNDLTRMYDYATWNMYERIVSARRRRLSQLETQQSSEPSSPSTESGSKTVRRASESVVYSSSRSTSERAATLVAATGQALSKNSSHDETSTAATADETDKSSTTSSSWSRTDSPQTFPPSAFSHQSTFSSLAGTADPRELGVNSCPPPGAADDADRDDHFIFQLDM